MATWQTVARQAAGKYGIDPNIFIRQIQQESGGRDVTSGAGAQGPAQFIPGTAKQYGLNSTTVHQLGPSLDAAARLMKDNLAKYGDYRRALSAYNSGRPDAYKDPNFAGGQTYNYVKTIVGSGSTKTPSTAATSAPSAVEPSTTTTTAPGVDNSGQRRALLANFLAQGGVKSQGATAALASGWQAAQDVPGATTTTTTPGQPAASSAASPGTAAYKARADAINANHLPYQWGGGHGGKVTAATPVDCSGAVSEVLGINPRVAAQFETWGKAGDGGSKGITIAAKDTHVLMKIDGHWFGTSGSNPGGGAGWIPQDQLSPEYLKGFTLRHQ